MLLVYNLIINGEASVYSFKSLGVVEISQVTLSSIGYCFVREFDYDGLGTYCYSL